MSYESLKLTDDQSKTDLNTNHLDLLSVTQMPSASPDTSFIRLARADVNTVKLFAENWPGQDTFDQEERLARELLKLGLRGSKLDEALKRQKE